METTKDKLEELLEKAEETSQKAHLSLAFS